MNRSTRRAVFTASIFLLIGFVGGRFTATIGQSQESSNDSASSRTGLDTSASTAPATGFTDNGPGPFDQEVDPLGPVVVELSDTDPLTFYVSETGDEQADGQAPETAWSDLDAALQRLEAGHTLYVMDGTYERALDPGRGGHFRLDESGRADAWIRVLALEGHHPILLGNEGTGLEVVGSYIEVAGLEISGSDYDAENNFGMGIELNGGVYIIIRDNIIHGFPIGGIAANGVAGIQIMDNIVYENAFWNPGQGSGISIWLPQNRGQVADSDGYTDRITGNTVFANENKVAANGNPEGQITDGNGIIIDSTRDTGYEGRFLVMNNLSTGNGGRGLHVFNSDHVDFIHNTAYFNGFTEALWPAGSELTAYRASDIRLINNLAVASDGKLALLVGEIGTIETAGNVLVGGAPGSYIGDEDIALPAQPVFVAPNVDSRDADFSLLTNLEIQNSGVIVALPMTTDFLGSHRQPDAQPDPGAVESSGDNVPEVSSTTVPGSATTQVPTTQPTTTQAATPTSQTTLADTATTALVLSPGLTSTTEPATTSTSQVTTAGESGEASTTEADSSGEAAISLETSAQDSSPDSFVPGETQSDVEAQDSASVPIDSPPEVLAFDDGFEPAQYGGAIPIGLVIGAGAVLGGIAIASLRVLKMRSLNVKIS